MILLLAAAPAREVPREEDYARIVPLPGQDVFGAAAASPSREVNVCLYFDRDVFVRSLTAERYDCRGGIVAATAPHHAPALSLAAAVLKTVSGSSIPIDTVIVIGPDHKGLGNGVVLSGHAWDTPVGLLDGDLQTQSYILGSPHIGAEVDREIITSDHAVSVLMPYIKHYLPDAKVTAMLIGKGTSPSRLKALAGAINEISAQRRVLMLASIDFSHFQVPEAARAYDAATMVAVESDDIPVLLGMDGRNLDSPECMAVLLELGVLAGLSPRLLDHQTRVYTENGQTRAGSYMVYAWEY